MRKFALLLATFSLLFFYARSQEIVEQIERSVNQDAVEAHIRFLASDELRGRMTGTPENKIAAKYIAERLRSAGATLLPDRDSYHQQVPLLRSDAPSSAVFSFDDQELSQWDELLFITAANGTLSAPLVFVGYGSEEELKKGKIEGKIVVARAGAEDNKEARAFFGISREKVEMVKEMGGVALIELYRSSELPWSLLQNYFSGTKYTLDGPTGDSFSSGLINDAEGTWLEYFSSKKKLKSSELTIEGADTRSIEVPNVLGWIEGADPALKDEYLIISAHFDHVGVKQVPAGEDSIWNGARDNAIGTTALLTTAEFFGMNRPARSILFLACNAEEVGLLGSRYYSENPWMPLDKAIFNFNNDGAGYNNKTIMTVIGLERTSADTMIMDGAKTFGLTAIQDPVPEQNLYDRSDNVSFAAKGVPAITAAPGADDFDEEVLKYYHQPADEADNLDYAYLADYYRAYILAAYKILHAGERPFWKSGDKYEEAGKSLYSIE